MAKVIELYPGDIQYKACSCEECLENKKETKEFYIRFNEIYSQKLLNDKKLPNQLGNSGASSSPLTGKA
ncbi:hypothetical protein [Bacillus sp. OAE603]|uniref:hypothetical protein n=1 Tax=Gottfriedia sp. OAE603 TaxID=2663872 RepID=UPI00178A88A4